MKDNFLIDITGYDVIIGYRADDSYFSFARAFINNEISLTQLSYAMKLGKLGEQIVLKVQKHLKRFGSYLILLWIIQNIMLNENPEMRKQELLFEPNWIKRISMDCI